MHEGGATTPDWRNFDSVAAERNDERRPVTMPMGQAAGFGDAASALSLSCVLNSKSLASWRSGN
jgi:hypothetical protein